MAELIPGLGSLDWFSALAQTVYWIGILLLATIIIGVFAVLIYWTLFNIKVTVIPIYGSGKDGVFSIGSPKKNRVKWSNHKTIWRKLWPLFNREEIEPFDSEYIYPGQRIYAFELNNQWVPGRVNIDQTEKKLRAEINPVPYYVRNWQSLTAKKHAIEFAKQSFWEENKMMIITLGVITFNLILCGATIYFTYKFAVGGTASMDGLTAAIKNIGTIPGVDNIPK